MTTGQSVRFVQKDWAAMSLADRIYHLEVEGYVLLPGLLDARTIEQVRAELADLPMKHAAYSEEQRFAATPPQWHSRTFAELIGHPPTIEFLKAVLGPDIVFTLGHYVVTGPGCPGIPLHADIQPYGSPAGPAGLWGESPPVMLRVLYYLDDLRHDRAPFRIIPRSHISLHRDANPYLRYQSHPGEVSVSAKAGDAIVFVVGAFHGTHPNTSDIRRGMLEYAYRPLWARPHGPCEEWPPEKVAAAPEQAKPFLLSPNASDRRWEERKQDPIPGDGAIGIAPERWGR